MKRLIAWTMAVVITSGLLACGEKPAQEAGKMRPAAGTPVAPERPSDADLMAFKVYHHAVYMETTAEQAGGTNKLLPTTELPTEGTDPVVTPALDHLYTRAIIDLSAGPVVVELPEVEEDRYFSIQIAYATMLARAGVSLVQAQRLMRHSTPVLTSNIYTRLGLHDGRAAVARIDIGTCTRKKAELRRATR